LLRSGDFKQSSAMDERYTGLKHLTRFRMFLVDECSGLKKKALVILDQVFPEYQKLFTDTFGKTSTEILLNCPFPEDIQQISTRKLITLLNKASRGRLGTSQAEKLKEAAANSFGITFATDAFAFELKQLLQQLLFTEKQIADLDTQIAKQLKTLDTYITSIPGIGEVLGATIISEIGDINTFEAPNKLVAFAGIDASVHSSGTFVGTQNHMSKRGSPYLRRAIWLAASVAAFHDPILSAYYQQLRARGKHHLVAINGVARKLCNIIYTILKEQRAYLPLPPKGR
jgi:transposase